MAGYIKFILLIKFVWGAQWKCSEPMLYICVEAVGKWLASPSLALPLPLYPPIISCGPWIDAVDYCYMYICIKAFRLHKFPTIPHKIHVRVQGVGLAIATGRTTSTGSEFMLKSKSFERKGETRICLFEQQFVLGYHFSPRISWICFDWWVDGWVVWCMERPAPELWTENKKKQFNTQNP